MECVELWFLPQKVIDLIKEDKTKKVSTTCACGKCVNPDGTLKEKKCKTCNGTGSYQGVDCVECGKEKSVLTEDFIMELLELEAFGIIEAPSASLNEKEYAMGVLAHFIEQKVLANYKKELTQKINEKLYELRDMKSEYRDGQRSVFEWILIRLRE